MLGETDYTGDNYSIRPLKPSKGFLLKNGFEEVRRNLFEMEYNNQYRIRVRKDMDNVWFLDVANMFRQNAYVNLSTQSEYVHNIQQILRGVGLDTLANTFKP